MTRWVLPITGFTESVDRPTGTETLWRQLRRYASRDTVVLTPRVWSADMAALARFVVRNSEGRAEVAVVAYSWGAGVGFIEFARAAREIGITVRMPDDPQVPMEISPMPARILGGRSYVVLACSWHV